MNSVHIDSNLNEEKRREALYQGDLFTNTPNLATENFCKFASGLIRDAFDMLDPETAQWKMPVEQYVEVLKILKPKFIHHPESKQFIQHILLQSGCDLNKTYFDVPRLRTSTSDNYLTSGIAYAFHPHRDTWYSAPMNQINWWMPIYEIESGNCLALHPTYWDKPVKNSSDKFYYGEWKKDSRKNSAANIKEDKREQPGPKEPIAIDSQLRIVCRPGGMILFSGAHLHSSVPNVTGKTRYSIDFRTIHYDDLAEGRGAPNIDTNCKDLTLGDFLRASDFSHLPEEFINNFQSGKLEEAGNS